jgi:putative ABC transport system permease protein
MSLALAARFAKRELRGGLRGFRIFIACLALGVTARAAVGTVRAAIQAGLEREGSALLGGDAEVRFAYRYADTDERAWLETIAEQVSETVDFRSMAVVGDGATAERGLTQVQGVDSAYPLVGAVALDPVMPLDTAFAGDGIRPGAVLERILADRLGLVAGDRFRLGNQTFVLSAILVRYPDSGAGSFGLGPRTLVLTDDLAQSGLLAEGTLYESN